MDDLDRERLTDMLDFAHAAVRILGSVEANALAADEQKFLAVTYAVQIVGEAANRVSKDVRESLSEDVPWSKAIAMRNRFVHGYRTRSAEIVVQTVREDFPGLISVLKRTLDETAS